MTIYYVCHPSEEVRLRELIGGEPKIHTNRYVPVGQAYRLDDATPIIMEPRKP